MGGEESRWEVVVGGGGGRVIRALAALEVVLTEIIRLIDYVLYDFSVMLFIRLIL